MIEGVVFDLDDTLALEIDYVRSGFDSVARIAGSSEAEVAEISRWLWDAFLTGTRGDTFDRLRAAFPAVGARISTAELVEVYRHHPPGIRLIPGMSAVLDGLRERGVRLGVLTDGPTSSQAGKVAALGLDRWFDPIVITGSLGPGFAKPGTSGFESIATDWDLPGAGLVYVGDNPEKDFAGPRRLGWRTIRFRDDRQLRSELEPVDDSFAADLEVRSPDELSERLSTEPFGPGKARRP